MRRAITNKPEIKAAIAPAEYLPNDDKFAESMSKKSNKAAPKIAGILTKKENLAAFSLFILEKRAKAIVVPDLEIPGMIARA